MNLISLLLPNVNLTALAGPLLIAFGILLLLISRFVPRMWGLQDKVLLIGWLIIFAGTIYWIGVSFLQDVFSDRKMIAGIAVLGALLLFAAALFWPNKQR